MLIAEFYYFVFLLLIWHQKDYFDLLCELQQVIWAFTSVTYNFKAVLLLSSNRTLSSVTTWMWLIYTAVSQDWYNWLHALIKCKTECLKRRGPCWLRWRFHNMVPHYWSGRSKALSAVPVLVWKKQVQFKYFMRVATEPDIGRF